MKGSISNISFKQDSLHKSSLFPTFIQNYLPMFSNKLAARTHELREYL